MRKSWAVLAFASGFFMTSAFAQDAAEAPKDSLKSKAVRLSDSELDAVTAGGVITVELVTPGNADQLIQNEHGTILILGSGNHQSGTSGQIVLLTNQGPKVICIPGGAC